MRQLDVITNLMDMNLGKFWEMVRDSEAWHATVMALQRVRHDLVTEQTHTNIQVPTIHPRLGMQYMLLCNSNCYFSNLLVFATAHKFQGTALSVLNLSLHLINQVNKWGRKMANLICSFQKYHRILHFLPHRAYFFCSLVVLIAIVIN